MAMLVLSSPQPVTFQVSVPWTVSDLRIGLISATTLTTYVLNSTIEIPTSPVLEHLTTKRPCHKAGILLTSGFLKLGLEGLSLYEVACRWPWFDTLCPARHTQSPGLHRSKQGRRPSLSSPHGPPHQLPPSGRSAVSRRGSFRGRPGLLRGLGVLGAGRWGRSCRPRGSSSAGL